MSAVATSEPDPNRATLPRELWISILDDLKPRTSQYTQYIPDLAEIQRIQSLITCALVCRLWNHCAQSHLYPIAWVRTSRDLWNLVRTLQSSPPLACLVRRLVATPLIDELASISDYLPIIPFLSVSRPSKIQLASLIWDPVVFGGIYDRGFHNSSVIHLDLIGIVAPSLIDILPFINSFRNLAYLSLVGVYIKRQPTEGEMTRLQELVLNRPAGSLTRLEVGGGPGIAGIHLFGENVEYLRLTLQFSDPISPPLEQYLTAFPRYHALRSLIITIEPWMTLQPPLAGSADEGERVWGPIHRYLLDLLRAMQSSQFLSLEISLLPQQLDPQESQITDGPDDNAGPGPWTHPCQYRHTRLGMIDALFTSEFRDVLCLSVYSHLEYLDLVVCENSSLHGADWWHGIVEGRLGLRPGILHVDVRYSASLEYATLWK